ncbi:MAG: hypothetical protein SGPRY_013243 [Prymnesium sp.]
MLLNFPLHLDFLRTASAPPLLICLQLEPVEAEEDNAQPSEAKEELFANTVSLWREARQQAMQKLRQTEASDVQAGLIQTLSEAEEKYSAAREELKTTVAEGRIRMLEDKAQAFEQLRAEVMQAEEKRKTVKSHQELLWFELNKAKEENATACEEFVRQLEATRAERQMAAAQLRSPIKELKEKAQALQRVRAEVEKLEKEKKEAESHQKMLHMELKSAEDEFRAAHEELVGQLKTTRAEGQAKAEALILKLETLEQARAKAKEVTEKRLASLRGEHEALTAAHECTVHEKNEAIKRLKQQLDLGNHTEADLLRKQIDEMEERIIQGMDTTKQELRGEMHQNALVLASMNTDVKQTVDSVLKLATHLVEGETECPLLFILEQAEKEESYDVQNLLSKTWKLTFVCASSLERVEPSVMIHEPGKIVRKLLPAYKSSMRAIKTIYKLGPLADKVPFAKFLSQLEGAAGVLEVLNSLKESVDKMNSLKDGVHKMVGDERVDCIEMLDGFMEMVGKEDLGGSHPEDLQKAWKLSGPAYRRIAELAKEQKVLHTLPMKKMVAGGAVAWVRLDEAEKWQRTGWACADEPTVPEEDRVRQAQVEALTSTIQELEAENLVLIKSRSQPLATLTENNQAEIRHILARNGRLSSKERAWGQAYEALKSRVKELEVEVVALRNQELKV